MAAPITAHPRSPALSRVVFLAVPGLAALILLTGVIGSIDPAVNLAVGVGLAAIWATALLVRAALAIHHADGTFVACRGAGFVGMGALTTGLSTAIPLLAPPGAGIIVTLGLSLAAVLYVLGTMLLPGAATTAPVRLRRAFDGLGLGISLGFAAWLLPPLNGAENELLASVLIAAEGVSIIIVTVLRARPVRRAATVCGLGAMLVIGGLSTVVNLTLLGRGGVELPLAGLPIVAGLALTAGGGSRRDRPSPGSSPANRTATSPATRCWPCRPRWAWPPPSTT